MKRTDQERIERELKRREKKSAVESRRVGNRDDADATPGGYIQALLETFQYDKTTIYNAVGDDDILEIMMSMKEDLPEKQWESVLRSAIRKTKVSDKELAFTELKETLAQA
ncbi:MAG: hypothetical protein AAGA54_34540 [Myxococcota bacterium]